MLFDQDVLALFSASMTKANITHVRPPQALAEALARAQTLLPTASTKLLLLTGLLLLVHEQLLHERRRPSGGALHSGAQGPGQCEPGRV